MSVQITTECKEIAAWVTEPRFHNLYNYQHVTILEHSVVRLFLEIVYF